MNAADAAHQRRGVPLTVWNYGVVVVVFHVLPPLLGPAPAGPLVLARFVVVVLLMVGMARRSRGAWVAAVAMEVLLLGLLAVNLLGGGLPQVPLITLAGALLALVLLLVPPTRRHVGVL